MDFRLSDDERDESGYCEQYREDDGRPEEEQFRATARVKRPSGRITERAAQTSSVLLQENCPDEQNGQEYLYPR